MQIKNTLGRDLSRFAAVCIGFPNPVELHTGKNDQIFELVNGSVARRSSIYVGGEPVLGVLQEPIADGRIGLAQISGVTPAYFRYNDALVLSGTTPPEFAMMSDTDDALVFAAHGPVRVLHRNVSLSSSWSTDKYRWVQLGTAGPSLGTVKFNGEYNGSAATWLSWQGDRRSVGVYGDSGESGGGNPLGLLTLCRPGRYRAITRWSIAANAPGSGYAQWDRAEWRVRFPSDPQNFANNFDQFGTCAPSLWGASAWLISGERSFYYTVSDTSTPVSLPQPAIDAYKVPSATGTSATALTFQTGTIETEIIHLGPKRHDIWWTKDLKDAAFARGATAGPI